VELYLDIYCNARNSEKTAHYIDSQIPTLKALISGSLKKENILRSFFALDLLKGKAKDDIEMVFDSWKSTVPFDIEVFRD